MTLHVTEIERVRPERRVSYTTVCSRRLYEQKHETLSREVALFAQMDLEIAQAMEAIR